MMLRQPRARHRPHRRCLGIFFPHLLHQHEALGIGDNLGGVKSLLQVLEKLLLVALKLAAAARLKLEARRGIGTLVLHGRKTAAQDGLGNQGDGHAEVQRVDGSPLAGALLAGLVEDLLDEGLAVIVVVVHDVAGDFNQERVQDTLVPFGKDIAHLLVGEAEDTLHDVVGLKSGGKPGRGGDFPISRQYESAAWLAGSHALASCQSSARKRK